MAETFRNVSIDCKGVGTTCEGSSLVTELTFLTEKDHEKKLSEGKSLSSFDSFVGQDANAKQKQILDTIMNLSHYKNEVEENQVPTLNIHDPEDSYQYTLCIQKSMWVLPDVKLDDFTPARMAEYDYLNRCQPVSCKMWKPGQDYKPEDEFTFRFTKSVIPYIYDLTIQFRVSEVPADVLPELSKLDNIEIHKALLMERTKRDRTRVDSTRKVKSLFMLHQLKDGLLISHLTGVMNTSVPTIIANLLSSFHELVASEVAETASLTRKYWAETLKKQNDTAFNEPKPS